MTPNPATLDELFAALQAGHYASSELRKDGGPHPCETLPRFGGPAPESMTDVYSWDETRLLVLRYTESGSTAAGFPDGEWAIVPRGTPLDCYVD